MRKIILNLAITLIFVSGCAVQNSNKDNGKIESQKHNNLLHNENKTFISLDEAEQIAINYFSLNKKDLPNRQVLRQFPLNESKLLQHSPYLVR